MKHIFLGVCGFETRCLYAYQRVKSRYLFDECYIVPYRGYKDLESRQVNEVKWARVGTFLSECSGNASAEFRSSFIRLILKLDSKWGKGKYMLHIDISSMSRRWYGVIPKILQENIPDQVVTFWYSVGKYGADEFVFSSINQVRYVAGRCRAASESRSVIIGLGFNGVRTSTLCEMFEGTQLYTIGIEPAADPKYVRLMRRVNKSLIERSYFAPVSVFSFEEMVGRIREIALAAQDSGDAVLVADGPKPVVLACSMIPLTVRQPGVVAVHVGSGLTPGREPHNICAQGTVLGFEVGIPASGLGIFVRDLPPFHPKRRKARSVLPS